jgi:RND family efflux transporter MFP subunit
MASERVVICGTQVLARVVSNFEAGGSSLQAKKRSFLITAFLSIALLIVFSLSGCTSKKSVSMRGPQAIPVQTAAAQIGDVSSVNALTGAVTANIQTNVGTKVGGMVQSVYADMGDHVSAGQALAQLDPTDLSRQLAQTQAQIQVDQANIQSDQANSSQASTTDQRDQSLYNDGALSQSDFETGQLALNTARAALQAAQGTLAKDEAAVAIIQQELDELTIASPVDGIVVSRSIEVGEEISTSTTCFTIAQTSTIYVTVNVSEQNISGVKQGTTAQITVPDVGTAVFQGQVTEISPTLNSTSQAYPVQIQFLNPDPKILPGMTASVLFTGLQTQPGVIIPVQSIEETPQGSEVFTVANNTAHLNMVQIGATSSTQAVVTSGLQAGEQVVITGQDLLSDNARVTVVQNASQAGVQGMINQLKQGAGAKRGAAQ